MTIDNTKNYQLADINDNRREITLIPIVLSLGVGIWDIYVDQMEGYSYNALYLVSRYRKLSTWKRKVNFRASSNRILLTDKTLNTGDIVAPIDSDRKKTVHYNGQDVEIALHIDPLLYFHGFVDVSYQKNNIIDGLRILPGLLAHRAFVR
jgi:hypothetical protein